MKKTLLALSLLGLSSSALAIDNGTTVDAESYPSLVEMNCTGTIIAGKWVLTAAHCTWESAGGLRPVNLIGSKDSNKSVNTLQQINHPDWESEGVDISLWELGRTPDLSKIEYLSMTPVVEGDEIQIFGFGQTKPQLNRATQKASHIGGGLSLSNLNSLDIDKGDTLPGDSGAPVTNTEDAIVGIVHGGNGPDTGSSSTRLTFARDFILTTINGWHYPTQVTTSSSGGTVTVEVQSLHQNDFMDNATYSGDVTVTGGSCLGATVEPFGLCTYEIESANGYEGHVTLDEGQVITVNKGRLKPVEKPKTDTDTNKSSGGGSLGFLSLLGLLGLRLTRAFKQKNRV